MAIDLATIGVKFITSGQQKAIIEVKEFGKEAIKANDNAKDLNGNIPRLSANVNNLRAGFSSLAIAARGGSGSITALSTGVKALAGSFGVASAAAGGFVAAGYALSAMAQDWIAVENKIKGSGLASQQVAAVQVEIARIARETTTSLQSTAAMYSRINIFASELGLSQEKILKLTESINLAFKAGGASAAEASSSALQLSQAIGSGVLQGDELRSVLEGAPLIAKAIAEEFGVGVGELRKLGAEGQLVADRVITALINKSNDFKAAISDATITGAQGAQVAAAGIAELSGELAKAVGVSALLGKTLAGVGNIAAGVAAKIRGLRAENAQLLAKQATATSMGFRGYSRSAEKNASIQSQAAAAIANINPLPTLEGVPYFDNISALESATAGAASFGEKILEGTQSSFDLQLANLKIPSVSTGGGLSRGARGGGGSSALAKKIKEVTTETKAANDALKETKPLVDSAFATGTIRGFIDDLRSGKNAAESLNNVVGRLGDKLLEIAMMQLDGVFSNLFSGASGKTGGGFISKIFGGFRAGGGDVKAGMAYITGEQGRELFIPNQNGRVVPIGGAANNNAGGNTTVQIFNNTAGQVKTTREKAPDGGELIKVVIEEVKTAIADGRLDMSMRAAYGARPMLKAR